jgi:hypothetical protein
MEINSTTQRKLKTEKLEIRSKAIQMQCKKMRSFRKLEKVIRGKEMLAVLIAPSIWLIMKVKLM